MELYDPVPELSLRVTVTVKAGKGWRAVDAMLPLRDVTACEELITRAGRAKRALLAMQEALAEDVVVDAAIHEAWCAGGHDDGVTCPPEGWPQAAVPQRGAWVKGMPLLAPGAPDAGEACGCGHERARHWAGWRECVADGCPCREFMVTVTAVRAPGDGEPSIAGDKAATEPVLCQAHGGEFGPSDCDRCYAENPAEHPPPFSRDLSGDLMATPMPRDPRADSGELPVAVLLSPESLSAVTPDDGEFARQAALRRSLTEQARASRAARAGAAS